MRIVEVTGSEEKAEFINFPKRLYRGDPCWVCPLDEGQEGIFDPSVNHSFAHGRATRWLLKDNSGVTVGRVAAFIDDIRSKANRQPTGGLGFFEVIEDKAAAFMLFDTARDWLAGQGIEAMDGPINFGENDNYWGLLIDGFTQQGFGMPYHKKYYRSFFEEYGFRIFFEQYSYHRDIRDAAGKIVDFPERMMKIAAWLAKRPGYSFRHFEIRNRRKYIMDMVEVYNETWASFKEDFTPLEPDFLEETFIKAKPIIDEDLIWFAYFNDRPIAFFVLFPDLNQVLRHLDGRMNLLNLLRFGWYRMNHTMTRLRAVVGGVHPSYQNSGVESAIFLHLYYEFKRKPWFRELELSWVGDFNPRMMAIYEALGATKAKTHATFRYMINKDLPFIMYKDELSETFGHPLGRKKAKE